MEMMIQSDDTFMRHYPSISLMIRFQLPTDNAHLNISFTHKINYHYYSWQTFNVMLFSCVSHNGSRVIVSLPSASEAIPEDVG